MRRSQARVCALNERGWHVSTPAESNLVEGTNG